MSDLSAPLKPRSRRPAFLAGRPTWRVPVARLALAFLALLALGLMVWVALVDDPEGGRPSASADISTTRDANALSDLVAPGSATIEVGPEFPVGTVEPTDIPVAEPDPVEDTSALIEESAFGPLPRISSTGETPFSTYARASIIPDGSAPAIAIVVSGLGLNLDGTLEAVQTLPDEVTLAFAPYGRSLERGVAAARAEGHEIFLEVPLEPFDYPDNDPGPDTLLTGKSPRDNLNKLFTVMGRFSGYAGLINNMGARFTASASDFEPVIEELGTRGLGYLDDGSSNRSLAPQLTQANQVPFARVDRMLDAKPQRAAILKQLQALEDQARTNGRAIGIVAALPVSVETVTEWSRDLAQRGITLVPASALMQQE